MKNIFVLLLTLSIVPNIGRAQVKKSVPSAKPIVKTVPAQPKLTSARDSASYAMGVFIVSVYSQQGITNINPTLVAKAIDDIQSKKPRLLDDNQANAAVMSYLSAIQLEKSKPTIEIGEKFLAENKKRATVQTTSSGLQYEILTKGTGATPIVGDSVVCHYVGSYVNGTEFENSHSKGAPITYPVTGFIAGWTEALLMMPVGSKWKLFVPYKLAYGPNDYYSIPGGSALVFELELLGIQGK